MFNPAFGNRLARPRTQGTGRAPIPSMLGIRGSLMTKSERIAMAVTRRTSHSMIDEADQASRNMPE
jgi:hypothetical protein